MRSGFTHRAFLLPALLALALMAPATPKADSADGGLRSVFAEGAGTRPLALGGAYAARADDASALFWNPGSLGLLSRQEFQAGHSSLYGLGMDEQYASLVLPSWRWGVAALGYRHFGVGGIEERDDRNVLLSDDLRSDEHQLTLAYGKSFGEVWSLGGALKLRRQELAGMAGNGIGLDAGLLLRPASLLGRGVAWLRPLSLGLSLRNALQPSLRLDRESVADPASLRVGLGYEQPFGPGRWLLPVLDIEKVATMNLQLSAGLELAIQPLALRFGYGDGRLSAGAGVAWRDLEIGYVFEDSPIEDVHRFSITLRHGLGVEERRLAALRAEDEALQTKLAAAFRARQAERIDELLERAERARGRGDFDRALENLATLQALAPGNAEAEGLAARCYCEKAERLVLAGDHSAAALALRRALTLIPDDPVVQASLERCEAESNRRAARSAELRRQFAAALDAFSAEKLAEAQRGFRSILAAQPEDEDAAEMLRRTEQAIRLRVSTLLDQAERFAARGFQREAGDFITQAEALDPAAGELSRVRGLLASTEERGTLPATERGTETPRIRTASPADLVPVSPRTLSRREREEIAELYRRGNAAAQEGRSDDALRYWELVWSSQPGYQQVDEHLQREYLMRGMELFAAGRLEEAANLWEKALRVDPTDERAMGYLARAWEQLARTQEILNE